MPKKVRKKTKAELADPKFRKRASSQSEVLMRAYGECEKLSKSRRRYILDVADDVWISRFKQKDDDSAFRKECRKWEKLRREFPQTVTKPLEIHCFTCSYNASRGMKPLIQLAKHSACDAGTAAASCWGAEHPGATIRDCLQAKGAGSRVRARVKIKARLK